jgi:hypothetical protein
MIIVWWGDGEKASRSEMGEARRVLPTGVCSDSRRKNSLATRRCTGSQEEAKEKSGGLA